MTHIRRAVSVAMAAAMTAGMSALALVAPGSAAMAASRTVTVPEAAISSLDPADWGPQQLLDAGTLFEGLVGYNQQGQPEKKIAKSWTVSKNNMVWTFHLRHNARWSNGAPVTAEDFYYAWMRLASPQDTAGALWSSAMSQVANAWNYHGGIAKASQVGLKVINKWTLQMHLVAPLNILPFLDTGSSMPLYPPDVHGHPTTWFMPQYFVGDGPYKVTSFVPNGEIKMTRNSYYVGASGEYNVGNIQNIDVIPVPTVPVEDYESNAISTALITSTSDYTFAKQHLKNQLHKVPLAAINYFEWDKSVNKSPLDNKEVRAAIAMAIDRRPIAFTALSGMVSPTTIPSIPGWPTAKAEHNPYSYNVKKARALLAKAGYPGGKGMPTIYIYVETLAVNPQYVPMAEAIASELQTNLGLHFKIEPVNTTEYGILASGGMQQGIKPGYSIVTNSANWAGTDPGSLPLGISNWITEEDMGDVGPLSFRQHAELWNFYSYDPQEVTAWGNPNNNSMGVKFSQWQPLIKAAQQAIPIVNAFWAKQPKDFYLNNGPGPSPIPLTTTLNQYIASYKTAKTATEKHANWVSFWKWVGTYPTGGTGGAHLGVVDQAYVMQHEPSFAYDIWAWTGVLWSQNGPSAVTWAAKISNTIMASAYYVPLNWEAGIYLAKPGLTNVEPNPYPGNFGNFYNLQYMTYK